MQLLPTILGQEINWVNGSDLSRTFILNIGIGLLCLKLKHFC